ncbi:SpaH/EbpB family LPXTG-anchored major pilin [Leucobacter sp. HY1910]
MIRIAKNLTALLAVALVTAVMLSSAGPVASALPGTALPATAMPTGPFTIEVHKYEQPATPGDPATGLPLDAAALPATDPVPGATFAATRVPGIDVTTNTGQQLAAETTAQEAATKIAQSGATAQAEATTDAAGNATLAGLAAGLYLVREAVTPAGFFGAEAFLVVLPLTNPDTGNSWLDTVHVYPKNQNIGAGTVLHVNDEDVWACQDPVTWRPVATIPTLGAVGGGGAASALDGYVIQNLIDPGLKLVGNASDTTVSLTSVGGAGGAGATLVAGTDYTVNAVTIDGREAIEVVFTAAGRQKLAAAKATDPGAEVTLGYRTVVHNDAPGEYTNEMRLLPSQAAIDANQFFSSTASVKFGALLVIVEEKGNPGNRIPGATVQIYRTKEDAAKGINPIECGGQTSWITDNNGEVLIDCLRLSNFENGVQLAPGDPRIRDYWAALTQIPAGWTGSNEPFAMQVLSTSILTPAVAEVYLTRSGDNGAGGAGAGANGNANGGETPGGLPITGGQVTGILVLALVLFGGGVGLMIARRKRTPAEEPEDELIDDAEKTQSE